MGKRPLLALLPPCQPFGRRRPSVLQTSTLVSSSRMSGLVPIPTGRDKNGPYFTESDVTTTKNNKSSRSIKNLPVGSRLCISAPNRNHDDTMFVRIDPINYAAPFVWKCTQQKSVASEDEVTGKKIVTFLPPCNEI